jgi:hypothetical protein
VAHAVVWNKRAFDIERMDAAFNIVMIYLFLIGNKYPA